MFDMSLIIFMYAVKSSDPLFFHVANIATILQCEDNEGFDICSSFDRQATAVYSG